MLVAPPIGTTKIPSPRRSRPARSAKVCTAAWSLIPSTSTTAHEPGSLRARAAAASATSSMSSSLAAMQRSTDRIYTTHVGSLARPAALLDLMRAAAAGESVDRELADTQRAAVADVVRQQRAAGLDVINDGEQGKTGFFTYILQRLSGYEPRPGEDPLDTFRAEVDEFP